MAQQFAFSPLNLSRPSIRLIKVLPLGDDGIITCEITTHELPAKYAALSYCWGAENPARQIKVVDTDRGVSGKLYVRSNLHTFLRRASAIHSQPLFWIDAICIDQDRVEERNHQVQQMGLIYQQATKVLVWLGEDPVVTKVFSAARDFQLSNERSNFRVLCTILEDQAKSSLTPYEGVDCLESHSYWSRVWIIQEIFLAEQLEIASGHICVDWVWFKIICKALQYVQKSRKRGRWWYITAADQHLDSPYSSLNNIISSRDIFRNQKRLPTLAQILALCATSKCSDPHDKLYAILSLVDHGLDFPVNYEISIYQLFSAAWSFFQLSEVRGATGLLLFALGIEAPTQLQKIVGTGAQPQLPYIAHSDELRPLTFYKMETLLGDPVGKVRIVKKRIATCGACGQFFIGIPSEFGSSKYGVWCTQLGTMFRYHIVMETVPRTTEADPVRFLARGFICHPRSQRMYRAIFIPFTTASDTEPPSTLIVGQATKWPGFPASNRFETSFLMSVDHAAFLRLIMWTESHVFRPSETLPDQRLSLSLMPVPKQMVHSTNQWLEDLRTGALAISTESMNEARAINSRHNAWFDELHARAAFRPESRFDRFYYGRLHKRLFLPKLQKELDKNYAAWVHNLQRSTPNAKACTLNTDKAWQRDKNAAIGGSLGSFLSPVLGLTHKLQSAKAHTEITVQSSYVAKPGFGHVRYPKMAPAERQSSPYAVKCHA